MARWFGNDSDGFSLADFIGVVVFGTWVGVTSWMVYQLVYGRLTEIMVDFYSIFCWTPLAVIGGLFGGAVGGAVLSRIGTRYGPVNKPPQYNDPYNGGDYYDATIQTQSVHRKTDSTGKGNQSTKTVQKINS